jgi:hypothetical protein
MKFSNCIIQEAEAQVAPMMPVYILRSHLGFYPTERLWVKMPLKTRGLEQNHSPGIPSVGPQCTSSLSLGLAQSPD